MYKNIILAIDNSKTSLLALQQATHLAQALKSQICLIYIIDLSLPSPDAGFVWLDMEKYRDSHRKLGVDLLKKLEDKVTSEDVKVTSRLIENTDNSRISDKIIEFITESKGDLLVLGSHGRRGFHRFLLGSVAEEVVRITPIPVLLIKEPGHSD